jgi:4-hydroxybenzoate polyprenyltransferase
MVVWIFVLGTLLMRSAGCVINDYADRDFDPPRRAHEEPPAGHRRRSSTREALLLFACRSVAAVASC